MIIKLFCTPIFLLLEGLINLVPSPGGLILIPDWAVSCFDLISKGLFFFPPDVFVTVVGNIVFWTTVHLGWAVFEWCYKKIPGVD